MDCELLFFLNVFYFYLEDKIEHRLVQSFSINIKPILLCIDEFFIRYLVK